MDCRVGVVLDKRLGGGRCGTTDGCKESPTAALEQCNPSLALLPLELRGGVQTPWMLTCSGGIEYIEMGVGCHCTGGGDGGRNG